MKKYELMRLLLLLVAILIAGNLYSQDKHGYITPVGSTVFYRAVRNADRTVLGMNELGTIPSGMDGLTVDFYLTVDFSTVKKPLKLLSFTNTSEGNSYLDIFYDKGTITIRRKYASGSQYYYDYNLYDPMFVDTTGVKEWQIKVWFTGYFFWVETCKLRGTYENNRWHAPIFFGINLPGTDYMANFLSREGSARLVFGDPDPSVIFTMPEEIAIYAFKYSELKDELQTHFCND